MGPHWEPAGSPRGPHQVPSGHPPSLHWVLPGPPLGPRWVRTGAPLGPCWVPNGPSLGPHPPHQTSFNWQGASARGRVACPAATAWCNRGPSSSGATKKQQRPDGLQRLHASSKCEREATEAQWPQRLHASSRSEREATEAQWATKASRKQRKPEGLQRHQAMHHPHLTGCSDGRSRGRQ